MRVKLVIKIICNKGGFRPAFYTHVYSRFMHTRLHTRYVSRFKKRYTRRWAYSSVVVKSSSGEWGGIWLLMFIRAYKRGKRHTR
jgi:hypothetical protein